MGEENELNGEIFIIKKDGRKHPFNPKNCIVTFESNDSLPYLARPKPLVLISGKLICNQDNFFDFKITHKDQAFINKMRRKYKKRIKKIYGFHNLTFNVAKKDYENE